MDLARKLSAWSDFVKKIRYFLDSRGLTEVFTEQLVPAGAFEGTIDTFKVPIGNGSAELHSSPEFEMKRLLAASHTSIYQITKCFRDDPPTGVHLREFTMLEYYRVHAGYEVLQNDIRELFTFLASKPMIFKEVTIESLIHEMTGIRLSQCGNASSLRQEIENRKLIQLSPEDSWEDMFFKLLVEKIEPNFPPEIPVLVKDYPVKVSALAKAAPGGHAERFEVYWKGMEICNGCTELADVEELKRRYVYETKIRLKEKKKPHPFPERLVEAMIGNFPPCAGVAVGLERLFWCLYPEFKD